MKLRPTSKQGPHRTPLHGDAGRVLECDLALARHFSPMSIFEDLRNGDVEIAPPTAKRDLVLKAADRLRAACNDDAMFLHIMSGNIVLFNGTKGGALLTKASTLRHPTSGKFVASK